MPDNWSAYRDESWRDAIPGTSGMQPRVLHFLRSLQLDPGRVPASNIVFSCLKRESTFSGSYAEEAQRCWPLHEAVIESLEIQVIVCFGKTAGSWVYSKTGAYKQVGEFVESNNRKWSSRAFEGPSGVKVVIATSPIIADWTNPDSDPVPPMRDMLG